MKEHLRNKINAILFDLDGTLLEVNLKKFIPEYLKLLASSVSHLVKQKKFISNLIIASEAINKNDGKKTNAEIFAETFFPLIGFSQEEIEPYFDKFYKDDFPKLRQYTRRKPAARKVMETAFKKGYDIVIATTPLLPENAIIQRLEWAGLADFSYKLITTIENTRSNKPNLIYYKEILEKIDQPAEASIMVGDEDRDMVAANLGIYTFLVESSNTELDPSTPKPNYRGSLVDFSELILKS